ncbi:MAG: hypothetical protein HY240_00765 [Actinobacteria bacterium]|nr:hypothetical protein [Actinomycetota bacterium]
MASAAVVAGLAVGGLVAARSGASSDPGHFSCDGYEFIQGQSYTFGSDGGGSPSALDAVKARVAQDQATSGSSDSSPTIVPSTDKTEKSDTVIYVATFSDRGPEEVGAIRLGDGSWVVDATRECQ